MRVLVICSGNLGSSPFSFEIKRAFINEQIKEIRKRGVDVDLFFIVGKGIKGYLRNLKPLKLKIINGDYDLIHAHFGLSGLLATMQRIKPVVVTFHGSDINVFKTNLFSSVTCLLSKWRIFVSSKLHEKIFIRPRDRYSIIPCGVDFEVFYPIDKKKARNILGLNSHDKYIIFVSTFSNKIKNYPLAKRAIELIGNVTLLELKDRSRYEVNLLLNAVDLLLMTSHSEGSPQVIKEAMACNCPVVSTDVGDVRKLVEDTAGCFIAAFDPLDISKKIRMALDYQNRTNGREKISHLNNSIIANKIIKVYDRVISRGEPHR